MEKWECQVCGYIYDPQKGDPDNGIEAGTSFEDLPEDWVCPECGASKDEFEVVQYFRIHEKPDQDYLKNPF